MDKEEEGCKMNRTLVQGTWKVATVMGIPIRVHFSWFIVFGLITWSLSTHYFPKAAPELPVASYWIKGTLAALLLFRSVAFHEISHSYIAKKYRIPITSITLFIFGGIAQMKGEPPHPKAEFRIDRKSTRLNSSHSQISYAVFCLKKHLGIFSYSVKTNSGILNVKTHNCHTRR